MVSMTKTIIEASLLKKRTQRGWHSGQVNSIQRERDPSTAATDHRGSGRHYRTGLEAGSTEQDGRSDEEKVQTGIGRCRRKS